jgi:hypothetical protein
VPYGQVIPAPIVEPGPSMPKADEPMVKVYRCSSANASTSADAQVLPMLRTCD